MHICMPVYIHTFTHVCTYMPPTVAGHCMQTYKNPNKHIACTPIQVDIYSNIYIFKNLHIHTYTYAHTIYICTHHTPTPIHTHYTTTPKSTNTQDTHTHHIPTSPPTSHPHPQAQTHTHTPHTLLYTHTIHHTPTPISTFVKKQSSIIMLIITPSPPNPFPPSAKPFL